MKNKILISVCNNGYQYFSGLGAITFLILLVFNSGYSGNSIIAFYLIDFYLIASFNSKNYQFSSFVYKNYE